MNGVDPAGSSAPPTRARARLSPVWGVLLGVAAVSLGLVLMPVDRFPMRGAPSRDSALNQMRAFGGTIELYVVENKALPTSLDALTQPSGKTNEGFLKKIPPDPWGGTYRYQILDATARTYRITSSGEDRAFDTDDDIIFPEKEP